MTDDQMWVADGQIDLDLIVRSTHSLEDGILVTDAEQRIVAVNDAICRMTGYSRQELLGSTCRMMQGPKTQPELVAAMRDAVAANERFVGEVLNYRKDGTLYWNGLSIAPVVRDGRVTHYVSMQRDISKFVAQRAAIENEHATTEMMLSVARDLSRLHEGRDVAQIIADAVPVVWGADRSAVLFWDEGRQGFVVAAMNGWDGATSAAVSGWLGSREEAPDLAAIMDSGLPALHVEASTDWMRALMQSLSMNALAVTPVEVGGRFLGIVGGVWSQTPPPVELGNTLLDRMTGLAGLAGVALDQTRLQQAIEWSSRHDPVTRLPNRQMLDEQIAAALEGLAQSGGDDVIVVASDIDRFKRVGDAYPSGVVDGMLREVAARIVTALGDDAYVARVGGDHFAAMLRGHADDAEAALAALRDAFSLPFDVSGDTVYLSLSAGACLSSDVALLAGDGGVTMAQRLLSLAESDLALRRGSRQLANIDPAEESRLDTDLRSAVAEGQIEVYYQPQLSLPGRALVGVEALVRWNHPTLGLISPVRFIPLAEYNGMIREIGRCVLETSCADVARWTAAGHPLEVSVNVAAHQLEDPDFADSVTRILAEAGLAPEQLTLEVTESRVVPDGSLAQAQLRRLVDLGITVSVDDFGTGYSSLTQLSNMPVGEIKIDRSFTGQVMDGGRQMVAGIIGFARGLELRVVAEGVETDAQLDALRELGCDRAQGYYFARPLPAAELERDWLAPSAVE
ncbi:EAL domain-containing protein [Salinibacterium sp. SYSU T00001]|uniref:EAL domain-containing protein n=1 Tax=Homoserinimonas sedimenticola TaxID=2986805 RepID=UPI002236BCB7|nr:EAL domain-containing protein [Salinibacterium sedimenticola]MCW4385424.1 EAL domain-containing protein [Salinibacterium sedimenticola]